MKQLLVFFLTLGLLGLSGAQAANESAVNAFTFADRGLWSAAKLHADNSDDPALRKLISWLYVLDSESQASFEEITRFITDNPSWPEQKKLRIRAEQSLRENTPSDIDIIAWLDSNPPITGIGKLMLAQALERQSLSDEARLTTLIKEAWVQGDFDETLEDFILANYKHRLSKEDHIARADRLLWEEKITPAKRMLDHVPYEYGLLYKARIALIDGKKKADAEVAKVPASLKHNPGLMYDRMRFRAAKNDDRGVREMLLAAPKTVPFPEKWWKIRETQIRKAIDEHHYSVADHLLANHGQVEGTEFADALWLYGWLKLEFQKKPKEAYDLFYRMHGNVRYPVSKARAAYWLGRAAEASGDQGAAVSWYTTASAYPMAFYGQLASLKVNGTAPLRIPAAHEVAAEEQHRFDISEIAGAIKLCAENDRLDLASKLITSMIEGAASDSDAVMIAAMGKRVEHIYLSVRGAKKTLQQRNIALVKLGYPTPTTPYELAVDRSLALAITRQESEFDPNAKSPSNALGMMQLLPGTAKETAKKNDLPYVKSKLYEPAYNWTLGSHYLDRMIDNYNGSYVMAIAAYNAGPGNVRKWVKQFGTPGNNAESAVNWIEKIPFSETRNYVQRVLENLQVYRHIEAGDEAPKLLIGEDLSR